MLFLEVGDPREGTITVPRRSVGRRFLWYNCVSVRKPGYNGHVRRGWRSESLSEFQLEIGAVIERVTAFGTQNLLIYKFCARVTSFV